MVEVTVVDNGSHTTVVVVKVKQGMLETTLLGMLTVEFGVKQTTTTSGTVSGDVQGVGDEVILVVVIVLNKVVVLDLVVVLSVVVAFKVMFEKPTEPWSSGSILGQAGGVELVVAVELVVLSTVDELVVLVLSIVDELVVIELVVTFDGVPQEP